MPSRDPTSDAAPPETVTGEAASATPTGWSPTSWTTREALHLPTYPDTDALARAVSSLRALPPLVTSWEVERLKRLLADAQRGRRFVLQGGDCAETLADCRPEVITDKLKILLQMSLVLVHGAKLPVVRIGRMAGQYAKPRSSATETRDGVTLPPYLGDLVNRPEFEATARTPDPAQLLAGYHHAALTLNFVRALTEGGFADLHHPEYWDLSFLGRRGMNETLRAEYARTSASLAEALRFMEAMGETTIDELSRAEFFTSHEGLHLHYESAQTRAVPRRPGFYDLTTHLPWIGERTRALTGAHVEFFRGIRNPVGVKLGPQARPDELEPLLATLNPSDEPGKIVFVARLGAARVAERLPPLLEAVRRSGRRVLWLCDPMHGNTITTSTGRKTRDFADIVREIEASFDAHEAAGSRLGGVHFELTGEDVTECIGGGLSEADLDVRYESLCDPRLNYGQALELAFVIARRMAKSPRPATLPPPAR
jgi:3-deoxy-7-phosphoheptulonate synthase